MPERTYLRVRRRRRRNAITMASGDQQTMAPTLAPDTISCLLVAPTETTESTSITASAQKKRRQAPTATTEDSAPTTLTDVLSDMSLSHDGIPNNRNKRHKVQGSVVWRRVSQDDLPLVPLPSTSSSKRDCKKRSIDVRVVEAIIEDEDDQGTTSNTEEGSLQKKRRRRLTLLPSDVQKQDLAISDSRLLKKAPLKVLTPLERLVDDSLVQVFGGEKTCSQHWSECSANAQLAPKLWLSWSNTDTNNGTLLHACALWNCVETTRLFIQTTKQGSMNNDTADSPLELLDGDGRTAYQVAAMAGHSQVCDLLVAAGASTIMSSTSTATLASTSIRDSDPEDDDDDDDDEYEYHIYQLDHQAVTNESGVASPPYMGAGQGPSAKDAGSIVAEGRDENGTMLECELYGGIGYWDEEGRLILTRDQDGGLVHESKNGRCVLMVDDDDDGANGDDVDSNHEDWDGNDYPDDDFDIVEDDDDSQNGGFGDRYDDDDDDDDDFVETSFRSRPAMIQSRYDADVDGDFDAAYGIYGQNESEYELEA